MLSSKTKIESIVESTMQEAVAEARLDLGTSYSWSSLNLVH